MTITEIINRGYGATYRYKDYDGNKLHKRQEQWRVETDIQNGNRVSTLYHYGQPLVAWNRDSTRIAPRGWSDAWLTEYSESHSLTATDKRGIRRVKGDLV